MTKEYYENLINYVKSYRRAYLNSQYAPIIFDPNSTMEFYFYIRPVGTNKYIFRIILRNATVSIDKFAIENDTINYTESIHSINYEDMPDCEYELL